MNPTASESLMLGNVADALDPGMRAARHIIDFIRWRFSLLPVGAYHWEEEAQDKSAPGSEIYIAYEGPIDPAVCGQRPAVTVAVGTMTFSGLGIGDRIHIDWQTGAQTRMDLIPTALNINVLSTKSIEAAKLRWFIVEQIWMFRDEIVRTEGALHNIGPRPSLGTPGPPGSLMVASTEEEWVACIAQFPMYVQHCATTLPMNKRILNDVRFNPKASP
jgi:hypothetical protein